MEIGEKFSKFPLETDKIPPSFDDDLSDLSFLQRYQVQYAYKAHQQNILHAYKPYIETLRKNSTARVE